MGLGEREKRARRDGGPSGWMALRCDVGASGHNRHPSQDMDQAVDSVWTASTSSIRRASCCACARRL